MTLITASWTIEEYHRMIAAGTIQPLAFPDISVAIATEISINNKC